MAEEVITLQFTEDSLTSMLYVCSKQLTISHTLHANLNALLAAEKLNPTLPPERLIAIENDITAQQYIITNLKPVLLLICKTLDRLHGKG